MSKPIEKFSGKLGVQQRVFPSYRAPFFSQLAQACTGGFSLFCGQPRADEAIHTAASLTHGQVVQSKNRHLGHGKAYFCWQSGLLDWLQTVQPDALIAEANPRWLATRRAVRWMHRRHRPVIGWGLGAPGAAGRLRPLWQDFLHQFDALIAYSQRGAQQYRAVSFPEKRIFVAPNAVLPAPQWGLPTRRLALRQATVLFVGRLQARKRVDLLLRACAQLPHTLQPKLWIVGDGPVRPWLEDMSRKIYPSAKFWGAIHGADLQPLWLQADLFVLPGTGGLAVQEAMSYGLPVIVARGDGTQDDLVTPETGWLIPPDDLGALRNALAEALDDMQALRLKGAAAYHHIARTANLERMVAVFVQALQTVTNA